MCQYSAHDGVPNDWHLAHLGARATGGFGLISAECTAVSADGRISPEDTGIWNDEQATAWRRIVTFIHERGTLAGIQLSHAGRKASIYRPWGGRTGSIAISDGGWQAVSTDERAFPGFDPPRALQTEELARIVEQFADAAARAHTAGFDVLELQAAHGFLLHTFLSPLGNDRTDHYGGSEIARARLLLEVVDAVRSRWPAEKPLFVRFSVTDWLDGGLDPATIGRVARELEDHDVDLIDISSGGLLPADVPFGPGYHRSLATDLRARTDLPLSIVGLIDSAWQADELVSSGDVDAIRIGRAALRDPLWPLRAAAELGVPDRASLWQDQYVRGDWP